MLDWSRAAHRRPNHVSRAAGTADVLARVLDRNREVIPAAIVSLFCTGLTPGHMVVPHCAELGADVGEDPEFGPTRGSPCHRFSFRLLWQDLMWDGLPRNQ